MASNPLSSSKLCFIGGGNMAGAIIGGLLAQGGTTKEQVVVAEPWETNRAKMAALGVRTTTTNPEAAADADLLVLAVKPQVARGVCRELATAWADAGRKTLPLVVSIAAGITLGSLAAWLTLPGGDGGGSAAPPVVRVMPNTPALQGEGASGCFAGPGVGDEQKALVNALLASFSKVTEWVDKEELIDVVTGLSGEFLSHNLVPPSSSSSSTPLQSKHPPVPRPSFKKDRLNPPPPPPGSGPAYFFAMVEHLVASATAQGLPEEQALRLAKQTCLGAGCMLAAASETPAQLRVNVTSPKGTTEAALQSFEAAGFAGVVDGAVRAAAARGAELGRSLGEQA